MNSITQFGIKGRQLLELGNSTTSANFHALLIEIYDNYDLGEITQIETVINRIVIRLRIDKIENSIWTKLPSFVTDEQWRVLDYYRIKSRHLCIVWTREDLIFLRDTFFRISQYSYWEEVKYFHFVPSRWERNLMEALDFEKIELTEDRLRLKKFHNITKSTHRYDMTDYEGWS